MVDYCVIERLWILRVYVKGIFKVHKVEVSLFGAITKCPLNVALKSHRLVAPHKVAWSSYKCHGEDQSVILEL